MDSDTGEQNATPLETLNDELQRSRSPLETVAEEAEGYQPILVTPQTEWKSYPLLVEDSTRLRLAPSLERALRYFFTRRGKDVTEISRSDLLIVLIYVIALETGLIPKGASLPTALRSEKHHCYRSFDKRLVNHFATRLPMEWFRYRVGPYQFELELLHEKAICSNLSCTLVALCSGDLLIVNLLPYHGLKASFSSAIPISYHVPAVNGDRLPLCYQYLRGLSVKVKNDLFVPFRNHMYKFIPTISPSLQGIPPEVMLKVFAHLDNVSKKKVERALITTP
uniref:F-box domain-containing protein n=1 Tax=Anopheles maculatus TaxID=74869 RepID=A0A182T703_9DIPT